MNWITDSRSTRKTAHIFVKTKSDLRLTYSQCLCGKLLAEKNCREAFTSDPRCKRCVELLGKQETRKPCEACGGTGSVPIEG